MKKSELARFIQGIRNLNPGQTSVLLRLLETPLAEPMTSEEVEKTIKWMAR